MVKISALEAEIWPSQCALIEASKFDINGDAGMPKSTFVRARLEGQNRFGRKEVSLRLTR